MGYIGRKEQDVSIPAVAFSTDIQELCATEGVLGFHCAIHDDALKTFLVTEKPGPRNYLVAKLESPTLSMLRMEDIATGGVLPVVDHPAEVFGDISGRVGFTWVVESRGNSTLFSDGVAEHLWGSIVQTLPETMLEYTENTVRKAEVDLQSELVVVDTAINIFVHYNKFDGAGYNQDYNQECTFYDTDGTPHEFTGAVAHMSDSQLGFKFEDGIVVSITSPDVEQHGVPIASKEVPVRVLSGCLDKMDRAEYTRALHYLQGRSWLTKKALDDINDIISRGE